MTYNFRWAGCKNEAGVKLDVRMKLKNLEKLNENALRKKKFSCKQAVAFLGLLLHALIDALLICSRLSNPALNLL